MSVRVRTGEGAGVAGAVITSRRQPVLRVDLRPPQVPPSCSAGQVDAYTGEAVDAAVSLDRCPSAVRERTGQSLGAPVPLGSPWRHGTLTSATSRCTPG